VGDQYSCGVHPGGAVGGVREIPQPEVCNFSLFLVPGLGKLVILGEVHSHKKPLGRGQPT
jgi:hypothetical protein